ncbi:UDP-N-acetylmuramate--L-alanine ligase [Deminuibacter soli]|uniref:UDP-N-acetylmuramate--L-alanine ligase n=1 Tax=Deminuibacter soli TaxID=2291815 RepID=A0A3E1NED2_9BACT|nr:UDP-N-acetylmuramate--L-alanine ligase [Deminuibacter soli]RFM26202.1 UDP-N-acetylmuramate--L-alanine ligase [Deminuibacter soli]
MDKLSNIRKVYFIGIGGIGMSALARYFQSKGVEVSGYDRTATPLTKELERVGMPIHYDENVHLAPKDVNLVVYTPAIPATNVELQFYRSNGYEVVKRSDVLQWITESSFNVCVGGTHGKTTITTMVAHMLRHSGYGCNAFLGGIAANYGTNFWPNDRNVAVIEADEYDRSFLKLVPDVAVVTAMDPDHLDIYGTPEAVEDAFVEFSKRIKKGGCLVSKYGLSRDAELSGDTHFRYHFNDTRADVYAANLRVEMGSYVYDVISKDWTISNVLLHMGGLHNVENSIAAITVARYMGLPDEQIKAAVADFKGVKRRFQYILKPAADEINKGHVLIDDYAHHPEELKALITGVRSLYGSQKCTVIFQPHLFSRTQDLANGFAESLSLADEVVLLPIYPARELPVQGVTSSLILDKMTIPAKHLLTKEEMLEWVQQQQPHLLVMAGAGDIDALIKDVSKILSANS